MKKWVAVIMAIGMGSLPVCVARADLVSCYTFDNTAANAVDGAPNGTLIGDACYVAGKVGVGALALDGNGDYVDVTTSGLPVAGNGLESGTIALWMRTTVTDRMQKLMCAANSSNGQAYDWNTNTDGTAQFYLRSIEYNEFLVDASIAGAFDGLWHHIAITWTGTAGAAGTGTAAVYLDGVAQPVTLTKNQITSSSTFGAWDNPVRIGIGGRVNPTWEPFTGCLDDIRVYNTVLSAQDIAQLAVPEPCSLILIGLGAMSLRRRS